MENTPLLFSLLFFAAFAVYLFFGIYIIHLNPRAGINKLFLAACISLCFWSLGFSLANSAANLETCLFWRRFSALGWATIYSILLHFFILLTSEELIFKYRRFCFLLYIPAIIGVYAFSISGKITSTQFNFVRIDYGWVNNAVQNGWTLFFNVYYAGYILACLGLILLWKRRSSAVIIHKQANLIFISLLAALFLGSLTDVVLSARLASPLPQMAPVFNLIPIAAIFYSVKHYGLMGRKIDSEEELILNKKTQLKLYYNLSLLFFAGALLSFLARFFPDMIGGGEDLKSYLYVTELLFLFGLAILFFRLIRAEKTRDLLIMFAVLLSIPLITLSFLETASITIWVFPIILMIASLVFNTRTPLLFITITAIIVQVIVWIQVPGGLIEIGKFEIFVRIGIFLFACWIGSFVNATYMRRLRENILQIDFQKMISKASFDFVSINQTNIDKRINGMLKKIGRLFYVDRVAVCLFDHQKNNLTCTYEWNDKRMISKIGTVKKLPLETFPLWAEQLNNRKLIYLEDVGKLSEMATAEKAWIARENIKSIVIAPIEDNKKLLGLLILISVTTPKKWPDYYIEQLRILTNLLAHGFIKVGVEKEIEYLAYYDNLTGLSNRVLFSDRLNQALHLAKRTANFIGVMFIDLDSFKTVNDILGHNGGDVILKEVAKNLVQHLRKSDTVARFGGDEFLIMINSISSSKDIVKIADNIMKLFGKPFISNGQEFFISCSAGIAVYPYDGEDTETLIKNADIAMYRAKSKGKNRYAFCTTVMKEEVKRNMILSNNLYRALERDELVLYYQPQIMLSTGKITGMEALLRWKHPEMGMIAPGIFIPLAEKNGLINSIGEWVLKTASTQNKKWQEMGLPHLRMAVNLSVLQFNNPRIVDIVHGILQETGLNPKYLELEITESAATKDVNHTTKILNRLKKLGITISIDDFGTEYSSLNRLKTLPIDRIKIDMQFIQGIEGSKKDQAITWVIINLAKSLGLGVLAEGVETAPQLEFLNQKMCDEVQGYYYYKPMPAEEIEKILKLNIS